MNRLLRIILFYFLITTTFAAEDGIPCLREPDAVEDDPFAASAALSSRFAKFQKPPVEVEDDPFAASASLPSRFAKFQKPPVVGIATQPRTQAEFLAAPPATHHVFPKLTHEVIAKAMIAGDADNLTGHHTHFPRARVQELVNAQTVAKNKAILDTPLIQAQIRIWTRLVADLKAQKVGFTGAADLRELSAITQAANLALQVTALKAGSVATVKAEDNIADIDMRDTAAIVASLESPNANEKGRVFAALLAAHPRVNNDGTDDVDVLLATLATRAALA